MTEPRLRHWRSLTIVTRDESSPPLSIVLRWGKTLRCTLYPDDRVTIEGVSPENTVPATKFGRLMGEITIVGQHYYGPEWEGRLPIVAHIQTDGPMSPETEAALAEMITLADKAAREGRL